MPLTILIADDHRFLAQSLQSILKPAFDTVGIASNGRELVELAERLRPNLIITDLSMPVMNGLDAIRTLAEADLPCKFVILTMHMDVSVAVEAFRAGASAFVSKTASHDELLEALQVVCGGGCYLSPHFPCDLVTLLAEAARRPPSRPRAELTRRQVEVLRLVAEGKTMKEIATHLGISVRTVESCKYQLMKLLAIRTTAELVHYAIETGVIPIRPLDTLV
jgi:DNA-binding NarL/FixJ family response regulator